MEDTIVLIEKIWKAITAIQIFAVACILFIL